MTKRNAYSVNFDLQVPTMDPIGRLFSIVEQGSIISLRSILMQADCYDSVTFKGIPIYPYGNDVRLRLHCLGAEAPVLAFMPATKLFSNFSGISVQSDYRNVELKYPGQIFFGPNSIVSTNSMRFDFGGSNEYVGNDIVLAINIVIECDITPA